MFWSEALAQTGSATARQPSMLESLFPMLLIFVVFYFLIILPQKKQKKKHSEYLNALKRGDKVLTTGGILGTVEGLTDQYVTLEIANDVKIKILKTQIAGQPKEISQ